MSSKTSKIEDSLRLKYIRILDRFLKSIVSYLLNNQDADFNGFIKKIDNNIKHLTKITKMPLYKGEFNDLEKLVMYIIGQKESLTPFEQIKSDILYRANQLDKNKKNKRYKKDKHKDLKFKDWD